MIKLDTIRRNILKKLTVLGSALVLPPFFRGNSSVHAQRVSKRKDKFMEIKPLGFQWETMNPFIFCVHHEDHYPKGNGKLGPDKKLLEGRNMSQDFEPKDGWRMYHGKNVPGFPHHPHRGFETITIVERGMVDHSDSLGASGRYGDGDVQWLTAGRGIQHAEMFPLVHDDKENPLELFQIWLNLPKSKKFSKPHFTMLWSEEIPREIITDSKGKKTAVKIIAGSLNGKKALSPPPDSWASNPESDLTILTIDMEEGAQWEIPTCGEGTVRALYFFRGDTLNVNGENIKNYHSVNVSNQSISLVNGSQKSRVLLLQAKPIDEPVVHHGPFVMNSHEEIRQAFQDYQETQFGGWPWDTSAPTHGTKENGRFAKHADGKKEKRS